MIKILLLMLFAYSAVCCSSKIIYLTPAITGQLFDQKTNQPIINKGSIFTVIKNDGSNLVKTDNKGHFYVEAIKLKAISESIYRSRPTIVTFNIRGYKIKRLNYKGYALTPNTNSREVKTTLDLEKVYLESN